jgi:hypothetical protein
MARNIKKGDSTSRIQRCEVLFGVHPRRFRVLEHRLSRALDYRGPHRHVDTDERHLELERTGNLEDEGHDRLGNL